MDWMTTIDTDLANKDEPAVFCIQLYISPSFEKKELIKIIERKDGKLYLEFSNIRKAIDPQIRIELLNILKDIDVSIPPKPSMGMDGIFFELSIYSHWNKLSFNWWSDYVNENWQPLIKLKEKIIALKSE
jgi:hypothetical protein